MRSRIIVILFLTLVWCGFSDDYSFLNFLLGVILSSFISFLVTPKKYKFKLDISACVTLALYIIWELIISSLEVAYDIVSPTLRSKPGFIKIPIECKHISQISLLANLISLTPGSLTVAVSSDKKFLIVNVMFSYKQDKIVSFVKNKIERKILRAIQYA